MDSVNNTYKFPEVFCSQCGEGFGPGDNGFSHCENHKGMFPLGPGYGPADWVRSLDEIKAEASAQVLAEQQRAKEKPE